MPLGRTRRSFQWTVRGILLLLLVVVLLPFLIIEVGLYVGRFQARRTQELQANLELARAVAGTFETYVDGILHQELAIGLALTLPQSLSADQASALLLATVHDYPAIHHYSWADAQGRVLAATAADRVGTEVAGTRYFEDIAGGRDWVVSDLFLEDPAGSRPAFAIARGLRDDAGALRGVVAAVIDPEQLGEVFRLERSKEGAITIIDRLGQAVYRYPEVPLAWEGRNWLEHQPVAAQAIISRARSGEEVTGTFSSLGDQRGWMAGAAPIRSFGWVASADRPEVEAMAPVLDDLRREGLIDLVVVVLAILLALVLGRTLTTSTRRLREHALAIGRGDFSREVAVDGPAEVRDLADAFNRMAKEIRVREEQREEHIAERERIQIERERMEASQRFLAEASQLLAGSLEYDATLAQVARLAVPTVADVCLVEMVDPEGLRQVAVACADQAKEELVRGARGLFPDDPDDRYAVWRVMRSAQAELYPEISEEMLSLAACSHEHLDFLREVGLKSVMIVPLVARERTLGAITFVGAESGRRYGDADLMLAEDLARRAALAIDNARLYRKAQEAVCARDEFLSVAAHELKTPVTSLRGFAQVLVHRYDRDGILDPQRLRRALQVIDEQSEKLAQLVIQLLDVSRIEAGRLTLDRRMADITGLVVEVVATAQSRTDRHTITLFAPAQLSAFVDPLRLEQVVTNLLDNAIKYSPDGGGIEIEVSRPSPETFCLTVSDHGIGVPPEHRPHIFDRFYRAHAGSHFSGMGLGLYISREIVQLHGGDLEVQFPSEGGTRFVASLPVSAMPASVAPHA